MTHSLGSVNTGHVWAPPSSTDSLVTGLQVYNSLTRTKVKFVPRHGNKVTWYNCGPTVYDASHMGHARNYVSQDILRRIARDYFGYDVHLVMNVTDIDDKIIERARQQHLFASLVSESKVLSMDLIKTVQAACDAYFVKNLGQLVGGLSWPDVRKKALEEPAWKKEMMVKEEKFGMFVDALTSSSAALETTKSALASSPSTLSSESALELLTASEEPLSKYLDTLHGATLTDPALSAQLAHKWEKSFFDDMERLNVEKPDVLTRVTEYVDQIVKFVQRICDRGYAYERDGSVYFDVARFDGAPISNVADMSGLRHHTYAKLQPNSKANITLSQSGEGFAASTIDKKHPADFALWKRSKPGEPCWPSHWGPGRPGWHIECSVMATCILGEGMDIHSGGVDLMFPHHDNELAQSEAYHDCGQWVNYFLHTGHLHIEGLKMSKSLKNFITIEAALKMYSARQLRLMFLSQRWDLNMDFSESRIVETKAQEATFTNLFAVIKSLLYERINERQASIRSADDLLNEFESAQRDFRSALCDSFNTADALRVLLNLSTSTNKHLTRPRAEIAIPGVVVAVAHWIGDMLSMFGLYTPIKVGDVQHPVRIGWNPVEGEEVIVAHTMFWSAFRDQVRACARRSGTGIMEGVSKILEDTRTNALADFGIDISSEHAASLVDPVDEYRPMEKQLLADPQQTNRQLLLKPHLQVWGSFYAEVARLSTSGAEFKEYLILCDRLRDQDLVDLGIAIDDQEDGRAMVKLLPVEILIRAREDKASVIRKKAAQKTANAKPIKGQKSPYDLFRTDEYSQWDKDGIPTHNKDGQEVSKAKKKKMMKEWEAAKKAHNEYLLRQPTENA